jgi:hypothetical protein
LQSRNLIAHTYIEELAEAIYASLPAFAEAMQIAVIKIQAELRSEE